MYGKIDLPSPDAPGFHPFAFLIDNAHDTAICLLDAQGQVTSWNHGGERMLGYSPFEIIDRPFSTFFTEQDNAGDFPAQLLKDAERQGRIKAESVWQCKDGTLIRCAMTIEPVIENGALLGFAALLQNMTRLRSLEEKLAAAENKMQDYRRLELLGQLAAGAAHDFTTLMTISRDAIARLRQPNLPEADLARCRASLDETIDQATALASQLLTFGYEQPLRHEEFDVVECLLSLRPLLETTLGDAIGLKMQLAPDLIPVSTDRHHFETAIFNLVANARDAIMAAQGHGRITIKALPVHEIPSIRNHPSETGPFAAISVTDTGPGIPVDIRNNIFNPFFSTKAEREGSGLGLVQVMNFARQSGGNIEANAATNSAGEEQGASFTLYLPRVKLRNVTPLAIDTDLLGPQTVTELTGSVLLVEDNARVAEMTALMLQDIGLDPTWARDAEDALATLHNEQGGFDLVLTDIVMPRMSGIALARIIASRWPDLPVVLVSGYSDDLTTGYGGDLDLIQKPFTRKGLATALARYLKEEATAQD